jgi:hypothetical protein
VCLERERERERERALDAKMGNEDGGSINGFEGNSVCMGPKHRDIK